MTRIALFAFATLLLLATARADSTSQGVSSSLPSYVSTTATLIAQSNFGVSY